MRTLKTTGLASAALAVLLALTVTGWAADAPVFVTAAQNSFANHSPLSSGTALNSSSVLRTLSDGSASLRVGDGHVNLGHRTQLSVRGNALDLNHGYVHVEGPVSVRQAGHAMLPASAQTEYEVVALTDGTTYLHVIRGQVRVTGFARPTVVAAGSAVTFLQQQGAAGAAQSGSAAGSGASGAAGSGAAGAGSAGAGAAGAGAGAAGAGAAAATGISVTAITVGAVAAAAVATGLIVHAATTPSSPSQP